ncbi:MAG TPA: T9SS type A sorting domain-containing protein, partial [Flavobacteriales bacterium]|nr:T9SS type A sorting domain-containing protein [Flavobacteriales bacterium]
AASGTKTAGGNITIGGDLTVNSSGTFNPGSYTVTVTGSTDIDATLSISTGTFDANGTFDATGGNVTFTGAGRLQLGGSTVTSLGTFTESTGTVEYDGAAQTVASDTYYNLEIDGSGTKTMAEDVDVNNDLTLTAGSLDMGPSGYDLNLAGDMSGSGSLIASSASYLILDGSGSQSIAGFSDGDIRIKVDNSGGTITTGGDIDCDYVKLMAGAGTFVIDGETVTCDNYFNVAGGTFQMTSGSLTVTSNSSTSNKITAGTINLQGGTISIGEAGDNTADLNVTGGTLTVSGGTLNIADELDVSGGTITQTGGTINIKYYTGSGNGTSANKFDMDAGTLNLTAGTLNLQGQASSSYDAMEIASGVTVNANTNHTIAITSTGSNDEDVYLDLNGHDIGNITMNNSSYTATFTSGGVILGDMTVTAGVLDIGTSTATFTGNFTIPSGPGLDVDNATISIGGSSQQTITSNGGTIGNLVVDNSSSTGVVMADDMIISGSLTLTDGTINTNSNTLTMTSETASDLTVGDNTSFIIANAAGPFRRHIGSNTSTYAFPVGQGSATTDYYRTDLVNNGLSGGGFEYLEVYVKTNAETGNNVDSRITATEGGTPIIDMWDKEWMIIPGPSANEPTNGTFGLRLYIENISGLEDNKFTVFKRADNSTDYADFGNGSSSSTSIPSGGSAGRTVSSGYAEKTGFTPPMAGGSGGSGNDPLPIELLDFKADLNEEGTVDITWATASEMNNEFFTIERSTDGADFETIIEREGAGTSNQLIEYAAVDRNPLMGTSYYRLKQTDYDGKFEYSELRVVKMLRTLNFSVRPNPATDRLEITFGDISGGSVFVMTREYKASIKIYNTAGKLVYKKKFDGNFYKFNIDVSSFDEGMYLVNLETDGQAYKTKFLKK